MSDITGTGDGSVKGLQAMVKNSPELREMFKKDPVTALTTFATPLQTDKVIYRIVVGSLGAAVLISLIGSIVLVSIGKTSPDVLVAIGSASVGALAGLLAPSPKKG